jgi:Tfp pilus assembly protein PilF
MAIFIFSRTRLRSEFRRLRLAILVVLPALPGLIAPAHAQHVITALARAEAAADLQEAYTDYSAGDYPQAHALIDKAEKLQPDQADGWNLRGAIYLKQGIYDKAGVAFSRAVALDPNLWAAQFNQGEVAFHQKDYRRAQARFDALLDQTNRFKEANRWELAAYKAFLSTLLAGEDADAHKRLAKLPPKGATPAYLYAQAALSFSRKDVAGAEKTLAIAQTTYPPAANDLFASSFETVGWQAAPPPLTSAYPLSSLPVPGSAPYAGGGERPMQVDPRLESAVADPLPAAGGAVYAKVPAVVPTANQPTGKEPAPEHKPTPAPAADDNDKSSDHPSPAPGQDHTSLLLQ